VVDDYLAKLEDGSARAIDVLGRAASWLLTERADANRSLALQPVTAASPLTNLEASSAAEPVPLVFTNPLGRTVTTAQAVRVALPVESAARLRVETSDRSPVQAQIVPVVSDTAIADVVFVRDLPALSVRYDYMRAHAALSTPAGAYAL